ncbi:hypothetical protein HanRHA438_Chr09g0415451 [Helianthus annuus]|nr:hypothetical protein HanRHA438_Chr09g0415451 [Helianthus annuus]
MVNERTGGGGGFVKRERGKRVGVGLGGRLWVTCTFLIFNLLVFLIGRIFLSFYPRLTEKTNPHPRQGLSENEIAKIGDYSCNFRKLGTKGEK